MDKQEVFDRAVRQLKGMKNGRAGRSYEDSYGETVFSCLYRSPNGPCLAGAFIPDEIYHSGMENRSIRSVIAGNSDMLPEWMKNDIMQDLLSRLQSAHDHEFHWIGKEFKAWYEIEAIAKDFGLNTDVLNEQEALV